MPGDEWFVGINGVPVGPIRLTELRAKAATGAITKESLVWRDGFEEWRPLKSFPELVAIVEEGLSSTRAAGVMPAAGAAPVAALGAPASGTPSIADPFAATSAQAPSPPVGAITGTGSVIVSDAEIAGLRRSPGTSPAAWIAMVIALAFGVTIGSVFFGRGGRSEEHTDKPAASVAAAPAAPQASAPPAATNTAPEETVIAGGDTKVASKGPSTPKSTAKTGEADNKSGGLKGLGSLSGLAAAGPKGPSQGTSSASTGTSQLDATQLSAAVARYTPSVKRTCWQPALDTRDKDAPMSARVAVTITVGASGSVQDVKTGGDPKGYRGLANCIAGRVRGWQFPPSSGSTTVNVPFVFVAQ